MAERSGYEEDGVEENYVEIAQVEPFPGSSFIPFPRSWG